MAAGTPDIPFLTILHVEDDPTDAEYIAAILKEGRVQCRVILVDNREAFHSALSDPSIDVILCDNALPAFNGNAALALGRAQRPDLPFILLSGSLGEEAAVEFLRSGATDYILKHRPHRLIPAIRRALKEKEEIQVRRRAEESLRESEQRYALATQGANDGLWDWNLETGSIFFSSRWKTMLGHREEEIGSNPEEWFGRIHPEEKERVHLCIESHLKGSSPNLECEYRIRTGQGVYLWVLCRGLATRDLQGKPTRMAGSQGDISSRKRAEEQLQYDAFHDSLTGLSNRNLFLNRLQRLLWISRRKGNSRSSVLLLGLDRFGGVNDSLGRPLADQVLREAAKRIERRLRTGDSLARMGGDEFGILMENMASHSDMIRVFQDIQEDFQKSIRIDDREIFLSTSAGMVHGTEDYKSPEEVLRDAGIALGRAKAKGKSNFAVFDAGMHDRAVTLLNLENDLRHAIEKQEFRVHYQPIVSLADGKTTGFEALIRWQHPTRGLVPPMEFIPISEESHLINDIGRIVLEQACQQMSDWHRDYPGMRHLTISVNVSGTQFRQADLVQQIRQTLAGADLDPKFLKLEITETAIMGNPQAAAEILLELREAGISLQIDDFGTGYSSLAYLHKFPMQALKIDRSFVSLIGPQGENSEISATIVSMAHHLGMQVIAEGIETPSQLRFLNGMGCDFGQGYLFSKPLDEAAAGKWFEKP